jgi:hypothetical protein
VAAGASPAAIWHRCPGEVNNGERNEKAPGEAPATTQLLAGSLLLPFTFCLFLLLS